MTECGRGVGQLAGVEQGEPVADFAQAEILALAEVANQDEALAVGIGVTGAAAVRGGPGEQAVFDVVADGTGLEAGEFGKFHEGVGGIRGHEISVKKMK